MTTAEKVALKLTDRLAKYTLHVQWTDGSATEFQVNEETRVDFNEPLREPVLKAGYGEKLIVRMSQVRGYQLEENKGEPQAIP